MEIVVENIACPKPRRTLSNGILKDSMPFELNYLILAKNMRTL